MQCSHLTTRGQRNNREKELLITIGNYVTPTDRCMSSLYNRHVNASYFIKLNDYLSGEQFGE